MLSMFLGRDEAFEWVSFFFSFFLVIGEVVRKKWLFSRNENNFTFKVEFIFFSLRFNVNGGKT